MKYSSCKAQIVILMMLVFLTSCSSANRGRTPEAGEGTGVRLSEVREGLPPDLKRVAVSIERKKFLKAMDEGKGLRRIRLVEVYQRSAQGFPQYRIFDVRKDDPYYMLGLREGDLVVAVDDWILFDPTKFPKFVFLLRNEDSANVEIMRDSRPILFQHTFR